MVTNANEKRTLLFINSRFLPLIGGGETYIFELMQYFKSQGWDVHLATRDCGVTVPKWEGCPVHYIDGFDDEDQKPRKSLHDMRKILDEVKPDLVHVHNIWPFFIYSNVTQPGEYPTILTIHNVPVIPERLFGNGSLGDYSVECAFLRQLLSAGKHDKFLVGSHYYLDSFTEAIPQLKTDGKSEVAYYFLPRVTTGPLKPRLDKLGGEVKLLFPSRVMPRKGIEDMLKALAELPQRFTLTLPAFANGEFEDYRQRIRSIIKELELQDRVKLASEPTLLEKMPDYYREADMVVIPSHFEGFGIVAVEAMSWGLPVIAAEVGGLREIVKHEKNGLLIEPEDYKGIAKAVERLADDDNLRESLVKAGVETAKNEFTFKQQMKQMSDIYEEALRNFKS